MTGNQIKQPKKMSYLRFLCENYYDIQKVRIGAGNQLTKFEKDGIGDTPILREFVYNKLHSIEKKAERLIKEELKEYSIWTEWLEGVSGIGPVLAGGLISWIEDPAKFATISKLWKYSGYHVVIDDDGVAHAPKKVRGQKVNWNPRLRTLCWKAGESFVKTGKGYRALYEQFRRFYETKYQAKYINKDGKELTEEQIDGWDTAKRKKEGIELIDKKNMRTKLHRYNMAKRKTVKIFLAHLLTKWCQLEGVPLRDPYISRLGDHEIIPVIEK